MSDINPYKVVVTSFRKRTRMVGVTSNPIEVVDKVTGEVTAVTPYVGNRAYKDTTEFIKLYDARVLLEMSMCEVKVFSYVMCHVQYGGLLALDIDECGRYTGLGKSAIYKGIGLLCEKDVIRRDGGSRYWVNPSVVCKGSRDKFDVEYVSDGYKESNTAG